MAQKMLFNPETATMAMILDAVVAKMARDEKFTAERACRILNRISRARKLLLKYTPGVISAHVRYRAKNHMARAPRTTSIKTVA